MFDIARWALENYDILVFIGIVLIALSFMSPAVGLIQNIKEGLRLLFTRDGMLVAVIFVIAYFLMKNWIFGG